MKILLLQKEAIKLLEAHFLGLEVILGDVLAK